MIASFDLLQAGLLIVDKAGFVTGANRALLTLLGPDCPSLVGQSWRALVDSRFHDRLAPVDADCWSHAPRVGEPALELRLLAREGSQERWLSCCRTVVDQEDVGWVMELTDITQHKRTEAALSHAERRWRTLLANIPGMVYRCKNDPDWTTEVMSEGAWDLTGYPASAFLSNEVTLARIIHEEDQEMVWRTVQDSLRERRPYELIYRLRTARGAVKWVWERGRGVYDEQGSLQALEGFITDITQQHEAETALREARDHLRAVYDAVPDAIAIHGPGLEFVDVNRAVFDVYGYTREEVLSKDGPSLMGGPEKVARAIEHLRRARAGEPQDFEWSARRKGEDEDFCLEVRLRRLETNGPGNGSVIAFSRDVTAQKRAAAALRASEERYRAMFERNQAVKWIIDPVDGRIVDANEAAARFYGYDKEQLKRMKITDINIAAPSTVQAALDSAVREERAFFELRHRKASGEVVDVVVHSSPIELDGRLLLFSIVHDVSDKKRLEEALRQAQKMEALGRLAGGVAHEFNNLMTVIVGSSSLMMQDLAEDTPLKARLGEISDAGRRAARLTRQLLAVGRRQLLAPQVIEVNQHLRRLIDLMRPSLPPTIALIIQQASASAWVRADPDQLDQVVLNLVFNARDAMPNGGTLTIHCGHQVLEHMDEALDLPAGRYVTLEVSDTGVGIEPSVKQHIFEPFYSTKPGDSGSGLGLATVYGIVRQSGGNIAMESSASHGSSFRVVIPAVDPPPPREASAQTTPSAAHSDKPSPLRGHETILVVDDDELVRRLTTLMLSSLGYSVLSACDGEDALRVVNEHAGPIHVAVTDVMMPRMAGGALAERLVELRPELRVLFLSGYVDNLVIPQGAGPGVTGFMQKPVTQQELAARIRALLES